MPPNGLFQFLGTWSTDFVSKLKPWSFFHSYSFGKKEVVSFQQFTLLYTLFIISISFYLSNILPLPVYNLVGTCLLRILGNQDIHSNLLGSFFPKLDQFVCKFDLLSHSSILFFFLFPLLCNYFYFSSLLVFCVSNT